MYFFKTYIFEFLTQIQIINISKNEKNSTYVDINVTNDLICFSIQQSPYFPFIFKPTMAYSANFKSFILYK